LGEHYKSKLGKYEKRKEMKSRGEEKRFGRMEENLSGKKRRLKTARGRALWRREHQ